MTRKLLVGLTALVVFGALAADPAIADAGGSARTRDERSGIGPVPPAPVDPESSGLAGSGTGDEVMAAAAYSPAGCVGTTHYPHPSSHYPTTVNVVADTGCNGFVGLFIRVKIWRSRWYGWETLDTEEATASNANGISENADADCSGTYNYRGTARHESYESSGTYVANTESASQPRIREGSDNNCYYA